MDACCPHGDEFVWRYLDECVDDARSRIALAVGLASNMFWIFAQAPQFYTNCARGSASGLSLLFLIEWFLGDVFNLLGAVLSQQHVIQKTTALLFVTMDTAMLSQKLYLRKYGVKPPARSASRRGRIDSSTPLLTSVAVLSASVARAAAASIAAPSCERSSPSSAARTAGVVLGWISAAVYLNSRIPQILKNSRRKSTKGLNFFLFVNTVLGNATYGAAVLIANNGRIGGSAPWLLGSLGTMALDFCILYQFHLYTATTTSGERSSRPSREPTPALERIGSYESISANPMPIATATTADEEVDDSEDDDGAASEASERGLFGLSAWQNTPFTGRRGL